MSQNVTFDFWLRSEIYFKTSNEQPSFVLSKYIYNLASFRPIIMRYQLVNNCTKRHKFTISKKSGQPLWIWRIRFTNFSPCKIGIRLAIKSKPLWQSFPNVKVVEPLCNATYLRNLCQI